MSFYIKGQYINEYNRRKSCLMLFVILLFLAAIFYAFRHFPIHSHKYPVCPWYYITNTYCPGCGTLRGISGIINGDILALVKYNILATVFLPILLYKYISLMCESIISYRLPIVCPSKNETMLLVLVILLYGVFRNFLNILAPMKN